MTEQEAKKNQCCGPDTCGEKVYGTVYQETPPGIGMISTYDAIQQANALLRGQGPPVIARTCSGSACMAWRWLPRPDRVHACGGGGQGRFGIEPIPGTVGADVPETEVHTSWQQTIPNTEPPRGYCGLAGKP